MSKLLPDATRAHNTIGLDCWCEPRFLLPCDECDTGCSKCKNGSIELSRSVARRSNSPLVIVHNERRES